MWTASDTEVGVDAAVSSRLASASYTAPDNAGIAAILSVVNLLVKYVKNKKELKKIGTTWYLLIYDTDGTTIIVDKALKDSAGNEITDLIVGAMAQEFTSSV